MAIEDALSKTIPAPVASVPVKTPPAYQSLQRVKT
jgi:hypothetical protein